MVSCKRIAVSFVLAACACGSSDEFESSPLDVSGTYTVSVTNRADTCGIPNWEEGKVVTDIKLTIKQDSQTIDGTIDGTTGAMLELLIGTSTFTGSVDGNHVQATSYGMKSFNQGSCAYTINVVLDGDADGDALQGTLTYTPQTNGSPDCGALLDCSAAQDFAGTRPP